MKIDVGKSSRGAGCLTVFGLVFLIPGLIVGFFAIKNLSSSLLANNWQRAQATILSSDLKVSRSDGSNSYRALGRYRYEWNGLPYESEQLYFGSGSDNVGSYHQDIASTLKKHKNSQQTIQVWVNPRNPSQAVIFKDVRWGMFALMMLFPAIFGGVGAGMIWAGQHHKKTSKAENELQILNPDQPWLWRQQWQRPKLKSNNKSILWFSVGFAIFWNLISAPLLFLLPEEIFEKKNYLAAIGLLFPIVGIGLAAWAIRNYHQWKRFGESTITLEEMPARLGQTLRADLYIPDELPAGSQCIVILECVHSYSSGSGDDRKTVEDILWQDQQHLSIDTANFSQAHNLSIVFKLPTNQPVSDWADSGNQKIWRLQASSDIPGVNFSARFEIPVFESSLPDDESEAALEEQFYADLSDDESFIDKGDWTRLGIVGEQTVQGTRYIFARARLPAMCFGLSLMALIFGGIGFWLLGSEREYFIGGGFSLFGILLTWGALHQWLYKSELIVSFDKLYSRSGWFMSKQMNFKRADVTRIYKDSNMSSGNTQYYGIYIDTPEKTKIKLATDLIGNRDVDSLITKISDEFGLTDS